MVRDLKSVKKNNLNIYLRFFKYDRLKRCFINYFIDHLKLSNLIVLKRADKVLEK
jgi:hypothetical protein